MPPQLERPPEWDCEPGRGTPLESPQKVRLGQLGGRALGFDPPRGARKAGAEHPDFEIEP